MQPRDPDERNTPDQEPSSPDRPADAVDDYLQREPQTPADAQAQLILRELRGIVEPGPETWERTGIEYFVRRDYVLVRDERATAVRAVLGDRLPPEGDEPPPGSPRDGAVKYGIHWIRLRRGTGTFNALRAIRDALGEDVAAPEYFLHIANTGTSCPADEPSPVAQETPPDPSSSAERCAGEGIRVVVIDTGFDTAATALPWMKDVIGDPDPGIGGGQIAKYAGHGTFIAGVVRSVAPKAEVLVRAAYATLGVISEGELVAALERVLFNDRPDVINMSAGTWAETLGGPWLLNGFHDNCLRRYKGVVLVAAAGNDHDRRHFWPAAAPWAVSVGALAANWRSRAHFSNFGSWVDVYAPGEHLINAFPSGTYDYQEPPRRGNQAVFQGMARWSGTSFSTPVVAALIAVRMSRTGENGPDAAAALLAHARSAALPGIGAVLLPTSGPACEDEVKGRAQRCLAGCRCGGRE